MKKKKLIAIIISVLILIIAGVLVWDYNNPIAEIDVYQTNYKTPLFVHITRNRFIQNEAIYNSACEFNEAIESDYLKFLDEYEKPYDVKVNVVEKDGKTIVTHFGTATKDGKEVEYYNQRTFDFDFASEISRSEEIPEKFKD